MKKTIYQLSLLLLLAIARTAKAQEFLPLVKDNTEWNIMWYNASQSPFDRITESLQLEGDTLLDDMLYKKVMRKLSSETQYWHGTTEYYSLYGLIREEPSGKVFYRPISQDTTYLLYDFGMNVNDTALMRYRQSPYSINNVIIRIDSITTQYIAGMNRRLYYVSSKNYNGFPSEWRWLNTWIEGIGAFEGLLYSCHCTECGGVPINKLLCYHEDNELLYMNPEYDTCLVDTNSTSITENTPPTIYFDPYSQNLHIPEASPIIVSIVLYDLFGHEVFHKTLYGANIVDLSQLSAGVYLVRAQTESDRSYFTKIIK